MCGYASIKNSGQEPERIFSDEEIQRIVEEIFAGRITVRSLDAFTYTKVAEHLTKGVYLGYGKTIIETAFGTPDYEMLSALRENVYVFSGAKTYQQTRELTALLTDGDARRGFYSFEKEAKAVIEQYNVNWLQAEYELGIASGRMAGHWQQIEKNKAYLPFLTYQTVGDGRVRPSHVLLDNITRPIDDPFWDKYYPPNGWRCRCHVEQKEDGPVTDLTGFTQPDDVPDLFLMNCGKQKIVYNKAHPYFNVPPEDKGFASINFGLDLPS